MYTSLVIESLIFIQVLFAFKWKVSHINICLVMLNFRLTLGIYSLNDISENGKIQRIKFVDTLVSSCCLFMNQIMIFHSFTAKKALGIFLFTLVFFLVGMQRRIDGLRKDFGFGQFIQIITISGVILFFMYIHIKLTNIHIDVLIDNSKSITQLKVIERV